MLSVVILLRLALAAVFCAAAAGKLLDPTGAAALVAHHRLPRGLVRVASVVPAIEIALGVGLVLDPASRAAAIAAAALLVVFSAFTVRDLRSGRSDGCACFGRLGPKTSGRTALARNAALLAVALAVAAAPAASSPAAASVLGAVIVAGSIALAAAGRLRDRAVEHRLLLFLDPDCAPCRSLLPVLGAWSARSVDLQVVTRAGAVVDREFAASIPSSALLVVDDDGLAARHGVEGTPTAIVLDENGRARRTVVGAAGVEALLGGTVDDDRRRLETIAGGRVRFDRRRVLALGAGSAVALALPGSGFGEGITSALAGGAGVNCPSCGDCIICNATGSPVKITCRPCKQRCSTHELCVDYANKLPAYVQLASYLQSKGFAQSGDSVAQGLQQNGKLAVFGTSTEFTSSSSATPRAVLYYSLTNGGGNAWAAIMDARKRVVSVAVVGPSGQVAQATVPPVKLAKRRVAGREAGGYGCSQTCTYVAEMSLALLEAGVSLATGPEDVGLVFAQALFSAGTSLATPPPPAPPSAVDSYAQQISAAIQAASTLDYIVDGMKSAAIDALCNQFVCTYTLEACCSYGGCHDSLAACAKSCPESLKYQAPCLVYLTGHGTRTYLGRF
ncbi:MAG: DoxX family membrane protein [Acidobacteriota bacterium]|nr:DoxX family membrane protein [Acidobacteriota bacterium]